MSKHQNLSSPYAVHPFAFTSNADPANDGSIDMAPGKGWVNTGSSNTLKVRNAANTAWEDVSVAGAVTTPAFGSNSASVTTYNDNGAGVLTARSTHHHIGVTSLAHTSNTFSGPVTLTASGQVGITSPSSGTFNISVAGSAGGGGASNLAGQELDYAQITSDVTVSGTAETSAGSTLVITGNAVTYDGAPVMLEVFAPAWEPGLTTGNDVRLGLYEGTTFLGRLALTQMAVTGTNGDAKPLTAKYRFTPSAGSHTYLIRAMRTSANGTIRAGAAGATNYVPAFLRITKV